LGIVYLKRVKVYLKEKTIDTGQAIIENAELNLFISIFTCKEG